MPGVDCVGAAQSSWQNGCLAPLLPLLCDWRPALNLIHPRAMRGRGTFRSVKSTNNTVAHSGIMAIWQGRASYAD